MKSPDNEIRLAMLISGSGSTMEAIGKACHEEGPLHGLVKPVVVITSRDNNPGIAKAETLGIPVEKVLRNRFPKGREGVTLYGAELLWTLCQYNPDVVTLNGFLVQISPKVIQAYKMYNQHPGPRELGGPGMFGRRVHAAAIIYNRLLKRNPSWTEVIAQRVDPQYDQGGVVKSERVTILATDTVESLQTRVLPIEHRVQIKLLKDVALGSVHEVNRPDAFVHPLKPWEHVVLYAAQKAGITLYPQG